MWILNWGGGFKTSELETVLEPNSLCSVSCQEKPAPFPRADTSGIPRGGCNGDLRWPGGCCSSKGANDLRSTLEQAEMLPAGFVHAAICSSLAFPKTNKIIQMKAKFQGMKRPGRIRKFTFSGLSPVSARRLLNPAAVIDFYKSNFSSFLFLYPKTKHPWSISHGWNEARRKNLITFER